MYRCFFPNESLWEKAFFGPKDVKDSHRSCSTTVWPLWKLASTQLTSLWLVTHRLGPYKLMKYLFMNTFFQVGICEWVCTIYFDPNATQWPGGKKNLWSVLYFQYDRLAFKRFNVCDLFWLQEISCSVSLTESNVSAVSHHHLFIISFIKHKRRTNLT